MSVFFCNDPYAFFMLSFLLSATTPYNLPRLHVLHCIDTYLTAFISFTLILTHSYHITSTMLCTHSLTTILQIYTAPRITRTSFTISIIIALSFFTVIHPLLHKVHLNTGQISLQSRRIPLSLCLVLGVATSSQ